MRVLVAIAASFAALLAGACGGGGTTGASPEQWSADVCGALGSWVDDLEQHGNELEGALSDTSSIPEARDQLVQFLDETVERTDDMLAELERAGDPAVEHGEQIAAEFRQEIAKIKPAFEKARDKAASLPDDPDAFVSGAIELGNEAAAAGGNVGGHLEAVGQKHDAPELAEAFSKVPECKEL